MKGETRWQGEDRGGFEPGAGIDGAPIRARVAETPQMHDRDLKSRIEAALRRYKFAEADAIQVEVHGAVVSLSGTINSWSEHDQATKAAWGMPGVRKVIDAMSFAR